MSISNVNDWYDDGSDYAGVQILCDAKGCRTTFDSVGTFTEVWPEARDGGWVARKKKDGTWVHACPDHRCVPVSDLCA
jgi:hypothetical protein